MVASDSNKRDVKSAQLKVVAHVKAGTKPPVFSPASFAGRLNDNVAIGTEVTTVTTTDQQSDSSKATTFQVISPDFLPAHFCIDYNKVLYVQKSFDVDDLPGDGSGNNVNYLELTVEMTSGYQTTQATVKVTLLDENDNAPVFEKDGLMEMVTVSEAALGKCSGV